MSDLHKITSLEFGPRWWQIWGQGGPGSGKAARELLCQVRIRKGVAQGTAAGECGKEELRLYPQGALSGLNYLSQIDSAAHFHSEV